MSQMDINAVLAQMRAMAAQAQSMETAPTQASSGGDFAALMAKAMDQVNEAQHTSKELATAFERGDKGVDLAEVVIATQKADVSFQAINQVRSKLVSAYQDIMNMPI